MLYFADPAQPLTRTGEEPPYRTVYATHPRGPIFHGRYLHSSWNSATGVPPKDRRWNFLEPRVFRRRVVSVLASSWHPLGILLVVEQSSSEISPQGRVVRHGPSCTAHDLSLWWIMIGSRCENGGTKMRRFQARQI